MWPFLAPGSRKFYLFTKQAILIQRLTALNLPLQLVFLSLRFDLSYTVSGVNYTLKYQRKMFISVDLLFQYLEGKITITLVGVPYLENGGIISGNIFSVTSPLT